MNKITKFLHMVGALMVLAGAVLRISQPTYAAYIFIVGAIIFAIMQFLLRCRSNSSVVRRLVWQQQLGGLALIGAGVLMLTHTRNEWIVVMFIGAIIELFTAYRIPQELDKNK